MHVGLRPAQWLASLGILLLLLLIGSQDPVRLYAGAQPKPVTVPLLEVGGLRSVDGAVSSPDAFSATSVYILSQENGEVLFEQNSNTDYAPASTTKLLTALVARQNFALDQILTVPAVSFADPRQPLVSGQSYTVETLLTALLVSSNNTAAYTLASAHPAGYDGFITDMNDTARLLDLTNSYFTNPAGFDDPSHRSTARDLGQLFRATLRDPFLANLLASKRAELDRIDGSPVAELTNTHQLLGIDTRAKAGKTGTTDEAKQVLITLMETNAHPYILVLLGSSDRYIETIRLADWVDQRYTWQIITPQNILEQGVGL